MFNITSKDVEKYIQEMNKVFKDIENFRVPKRMPKDLGLYLSIHLDLTNPFHRETLLYRDKYIRQVGFARISQDWVNPLARWIGKRKCLEVMAGSGALTYALRELGVKIIATDDFSWSKPFKPWIKVDNMDCIVAVERFGKEVDFVICSWPYMDDTAYRLLLKMREVNPKCRMIYIGEGWGGCTANDDFFEIAIEDNVKGFYDAVSNFSSWDGIHDRIKLYK